MQILRVSALWTGFTGAPGYSNFHFAADPGFWDGGIIGNGAQVAAQAASERVADAFFELLMDLPEGVRVSTESEVELLDSDSGEILGAIEVEPRATTVTYSSGGYSAATGGVVNWRTNDYRNGRRIRGRTFVVPLNGNAYEEDGTLSSSARGNLQDFAAAIIGGGDAPEFGVWSRPINGSGGVFATVVSAQVPDMAAVLRSRRD